MEDGLHAIKIVGWCIGVLTIFHPYTPLTTPFAINDDAELNIYAFDRFLVHGDLHENEHVGHEYASCTLVEPGIFLAQAPFHIPGVYAIVHDMEGGIEEGWQRTHVGMGDVEASPLFGCEGVENSEHFVRVGLEPGEGFFAWQAAKCLGVLIKSLAHGQ